MIGTAVASPVGEQCYPVICKTTSVRMDTVLLSVQQTLIQLLEAGWLTAEHLVLVSLCLRAALECQDQEIGISRSPRPAPRSVRCGHWGGPGDEAAAPGRDGGGEPPSPGAPGHHPSPGR